MRRGRERPIKANAPTKLKEVNDDRGSSQTPMGNNSSSVTTTSSGKQAYFERSRNGRIEIVKRKRQKMLA